MIMFALAAVRSPNGLICYSNQKSNRKTQSRQERKTNFCLDKFMFMYVFVKNFPFLFLLWPTENTICQMAVESMKCK